MAVENGELRYLVRTICESLGVEERRTLLYLSETPDAEPLSEALLSRVAASGRGRYFLVEILLHLKRFDVLRKVFRIGRAELEGSLDYLPRYRVLMVDISDNMDSEDLRRLKFLLHGTVTREKIDQAQSFLDLALELEKLDLLSSDKVDFVEDCFRDIERVDLAKKVKKYKTSVASPEPHSNQLRRQRLPSPCGASNTSCSRPPRTPGRCDHAENAAPPLHREQTPINMYKFTTSPRGICLIIDCVGNDGEMLENLFKSLEFNVILQKWPTAEDVLSTLREVSGGREYHKGDGFVCCIISRGTSGHLLATDSYSQRLTLDRVRRLFTAEACPSLAGKPKLFFIQRYSVPESGHGDPNSFRDEDLETDGHGEASGRFFVPSNADMFWSHCWTDEHLLLQEHHRSIYLKALTDTIHKSQRRRRHLVDIHVEMNRTIYEHNSRNPGEEYHIDLKHTLRKELYL